MPILQFAVPLLALVTLAFRKKHQPGGEGHANPFGSTSLGSLCVSESLAVFFVRASSDLTTERAIDSSLSSQYIFRACHTCVLLLVQSHLTLHIGQPNMMHLLLLSLSSQNSRLLLGLKDSPCRTTLQPRLTSQSEPI